MDLGADYCLPPEKVPLYQPETLTTDERDDLKEEIRDLLTKRGAALVAHYYVRR